MTIDATISPAPPPVLSPRRFVLLAAEIVLIALLLGGLVVYAATRDPAGRATARLATGDLILYATQAVVLALAVATASVLPRALRARNRVAAMTLSAIVIMYGATAAGVELLKVAAQERAPSVITLSAGRARTSAATPAPAGAPAVATGMPSAPAFDPVAGKKAYAASCAACHGPSGEGLAGVAPQLTGSAFIRDNSEQAIAQLIINGVAATDPANKTGKVMPARGGNPFLSDADVMNIVAYLRGDPPAAAPANADARTPGDSGAAAAPAVEDPAASLPRWVVPAPPRPDSALHQTAAATPSPHRKPAAGSWFRLAFGWVLAIHLLIGLALTGGVMWQAYAGSHAAPNLAPARFVRIYWYSAIVVWLAQLPSLAIV